MSYATLDDVKQHLRYDDNSNDTVLQAYLDASEQVINNFITDAVTDGMQPALRAATLLLCGYLDDDRNGCLLYTSPSPRDQRGSRMPSSA